MDADRRSLPRELDGDALADPDPGSGNEHALSGEHPHGYPANGVAGRPRTPGRQANSEPASGSRAAPRDAVVT